MQTANPPERDPFRVPDAVRSGVPALAHSSGAAWSDGGGTEQGRRQQPQAAATWAAQAQAWAQLAEQAAALAATIPDGEPGPAQVKAIKAATTKLDRHTGAVEKRLGGGAPKA